MSQANNAPDTPVPDVPPKVAPENVTLRSQPRPVTRLNRRMLAVLAGGLATAVLGGTYYIFPKMTGRMYNETLGKLGFWLFFIGANITFSFTLYMGAAYGMPRRYYDYAQFPEVEGLQQIATYGSYVILLGAIVVLISWIHALVAGEKAPLNPWGSRSLEWTHTASPPPIGNFAEPVKLSEDWDPYGYKKD